MADNQGSQCPDCKHPCAPEDEECEDCGFPFDRPKIRTQCPKCQDPRRKNKRGVYKKYCSSCKYKFEGKTEYSFICTRNLASSTLFS